MQMVLSHPSVIAVVRIFGKMLWSLKYIFVDKWHIENGSCFTFLLLLKAFEKHLFEEKEEQTNCKAPDCSDVKSNLDKIILSTNPLYFNPSLSWRGLTARQTKISALTTPHICQLIGIGHIWAHWASEDLGIYEYMIFVNTSAPVKASERSFGSDLSVCLSVLTFTYV